MSKVGLDRRAYIGAPKMLRSVWSDRQELLVPETHWSWDKARKKRIGKRHILTEAKKRLLENL